MTLISTSFALLGGLTLTLAACSSGASGSDGAFDAPPTTTDDEPVTTDDTEESTSSSGGDTESGVESTSTDDPSAATTATTSSTGAPADAPGQLVWTLAVPTVDYGDIPVDSSASTIIALENVGDHAATSMATVSIPGDFSFPGGYPGTEGTCGSDLEAGETCRLQLRFGPNHIGPVESALSVEYYDGVNLGMPTQTDLLSLRGAGQGESDNLLVNGGAETGDILPWAPAPGSASWTTSDAAFSGRFSFTPTGAFGVALLDQEVALGSWQDETSVPGARYRVRVRAQSTNGADPYRVLIRFGGDFEAIPGGIENSWTLLEYADTLPADASEVTVRLECANNELLGGACEVAFDDVTLQLVYP